MTTAPAVTENSGPPALASLTDTFEPVAASDIKPSKLYVQQALSEFVKAGVAKPGYLVMAADVDDPAPTVLIGEDSDHVIAYVIGRAKFAATTSGGGFEFHNTPHRDPADPDSWEGWFFDLAIPEHDSVLPVRWMLWKTAGDPAAKAINTLIQREHSAGNTDPLAIRISIRQKTSRKGHQYYSPAITAAQPNKGDVAVAKSIQQTLMGLNSARASENSAPVVQAQPDFI